MKKALFLLLLIAAYTKAYTSPSVDKWWKNANTFYEQKQYDSAAHYYEKIAALKPDNATVYYNLGNTYYRLNQVGPAVLNYERALKLDPDNKPVQDNLYITQNRISNRIISVPDIFFVRWWQSITAADNATAWAIGSLVFFLIFIGILYFKFVKRNDIPAQLIAGTTFIWLIVLVIAFISANNKAQNTRAVVMQSDAPFMPAPQYGKAQSLVPEGTVVGVEDEKNGWVEVKLPDGRSGWMEKMLLTKI